MELKYQKTKTIRCRDNNKSSDIVSANFILGCTKKNTENYESPCLYCYVARWGRKKVYINTNTDEILNECTKWVETKPFVKIPNQIDDKLYYSDIGCDVDVNYYWKEYNWIKVFDYFKNSKYNMGATFATKWVNTKLLEYSLNNRIRVRMSLMPENIRKQVESGTSPTINRIKFLDKLYNANYSTHINFSPIIYTSTWKEDYVELFKLISKNVSESCLKQIGLECIFLTHNANLHFNNLNRSLNEDLLWNPELQEAKKSEYGGDNLRYKYPFKQKLVKEFTELVNFHLPLCKIRYIF